MRKQVKIIQFYLEIKVDGKIEKLQVDAKSIKTFNWKKDFELGTYFIEIEGMMIK